MPTMAIINTGFSA